MKRLTQSHPRELGEMETFCSGNLSAPLNANSEVGARLRGRELESIRVPRVVFGGPPKTSSNHLSRLPGAPSRQSLPEARVVASWKSAPSSVGDYEGPGGTPTPARRRRALPNPGSECGLK